MRVFLHLSHVLFLEPVFISPFNITVHTNRNSNNFESSVWFTKNFIKKIAFFQCSTTSTAKRKKKKKELKEVFNV